MSFDFLHQSLRLLTQNLVFDCSKNQFQIQFDLGHRIIEQWVSRVEEIRLVTELRDTDFSDKKAYQKAVDFLIRLDYELKTDNDHIRHFERVKREAIALHALNHTKTIVGISERVRSAL